MSYEAERFDNRWIMLRRKREKLELQLSEAIWIKNSIVRRTPKVNRYIYISTYNKFGHARTKKLSLKEHFLCVHQSVCRLSEVCGE